MHRSFSLAALAGAAFLAVGASAHAGVAQPGSLLLFPCYDNARGSDTLITVTNESADPQATNIKVEYVYVNAYGCLETNRTRTLTPNDTLTVSTYLDNPNAQRGYLWVFAKDLLGRAIKHDHLIGTAHVAGGGGEDDLEYAPFVFKAGAALAAGALTDLDSDGIRDLNGNEYEPAPEEILFPRFLGQEGGGNAGKELSNSNVSTLVLINLTGGAQFDAIVDFLVYNDNEEVFSAQYQFRCWKKVNLLQISNVFADWFLATTNHAANESIDGSESGWFRIDGNVANSSAASFQDPAVLGALIERIDGSNSAVLPFAVGTQNNGDLLPLGVLGDNGL
ncbi:MAG: hypothetical protein HZA53_06835 [Planctomycetes bacterium]|nr:hypothetical protein [Planctomycetota bacterium]